MGLYTRPFFSVPFGSAETLCWWIVKDFKEHSLLQQIPLILVLIARVACYMSILPGVSRIPDLQIQSWHLCWVIYSVAGFHPLETSNSPLMCLATMTGTFKSQWIISPLPTLSGLPITQNHFDDPSGPIIMTDNFISTGRGVGGREGGL